MSLPLHGIRVVAVEQYGAGPYGTQLLADLGAEVVKVENPETGGDVSRFVSPHTIGEADSQFFQTFNRNKKSVSLDLKSEEGRADFRRLVETADAVANNLRGDLPAKLGLDYAALSAVKPAIVCAHLSAYGRTGSRAAWPGYDYLMQAEAGFCSLTGEPDGPPARFGLSMVDFMTGSMMATGLVAAVLGAHRTGRGCDVDVSLFDTALHQLSYPATWYLNAGDVTRRRERGAHPAIAPSQLMQARDGWIMFCCQTQKFWEATVVALETPSLLDDERFATPHSRSENRAALEAAMEDVLRTRPVAEWMERFAGRVPAAPVYDVQQALENPYVAEVEMTYEADHGGTETGTIRLLASPYRVDGRRLTGGVAPALGADTAELLG